MPGFPVMTHVDTSIRNNMYSSLPFLPHGYKVFLMRDDIMERTHNAGSPKFVR